jgi:hypothetical protein
MATNNDTTNEIVVNINTQQGEYIASKTKLEFRKDDLVLDSGVIKVGEKTTLHGWFTKPIEFLGFHGENGAVFYLGEDSGDLFSGDTYFYDVTYIIASNRIGKSYKAGSFRDVFLRQNKKGYFWK